jgi:steroid delta-isomerase-like uncharacterized protein
MPDGQNDLVGRARCQTSRKAKRLSIMTNEDGSRAAAEYVVLGTYLEADTGLPPAHGQRYRLAGGAFFEVSDGRVARVTNYYNVGDWLRQVSAG